MPANPEFEALYGAAPAVMAEAPGRVNLIGDHTDYQGGYVLPVATPARTRVRLLPRGGDRVRAYSAELAAGEPPLSYRIGQERAGRGWLDYVQGVTFALHRAGHALGGFDLHVESDVPVGAGLASSAALEVALLRALREAFGLVIDDVSVAVLGRSAETEFVGVPIGIMDPMAASLGDTDAALFLDTRTLQYERIRLPPEIGFVVIGSGVAHSHAGGEYRVRRSESTAAARALGVGELRDVSAGDRARLEMLPEPLGRRARHIVTENERVLSAVDALRRADASQLGRLFAESHASLRDDYAVSVPEIDLLVEIATACNGVFGARLTGGGFGGSIVVAVDPSASRALAEHTAAEYARRTGRVASICVMSRAA